MKRICWTEHFFELYPTEPRVDQSAINSLSDMPVWEDLDIELDIKELQKNFIFRLEI